MIADWRVDARRRPIAFSAYLSIQLSGVCLRPNGTTDLRLKRYQLIICPWFSSVGRISIPKSCLREPYGQVLCNQKLIVVRGLFRAKDRSDAPCVTWNRLAAFAVL